MAEKDTIVFNTKFDNGQESANIIRCNVKNVSNCQYRKPKPGGQTLMHCMHPFVPSPSPSAFEINVRRCIMQIKTK